MKRAPKITIAIVAGALLIAAEPAVGEVLIYDRGRILHGEAWRIFTGHFVHLSREHLLWDLAAIAIVGSICERENGRGFGALCMAAPIIISVAALVFEPDMHRYAGLSALAMSALTFFALSQKNRVIAFILILLVSAKVAFELTADTSIFLTATKAETRVASLSHLIGAMVGAVFAWIPSCLSGARWAKQGRSESPDYSRQI